jgi:sugar lactone lactonase YvrE
MGARVMLGFCASLALLVSCGAHGTLPTATPKALTAKEVPGIRTVTILPSGYAPVNHLSADPSQSGVWFWSWTSATARAFFWNARNKALSSWALGPTWTDHLDVYAESGLAVDSHGDLWIGALNQLVELNPRTGLATFTPLPEPADSLIAESARPPTDRGYHHIHAIAVDASGRIVVAFSAASQLEVFDPTSKAVTTIGLPAIGDVEDLATLSNGTIAVAMLDELVKPYQADSLVIVKPDGSERTIHVDSSHVSSNGTSFVTPGNPSPSVIGLAQLADSSNATNVSIPPAVASLVGPDSLALQLPDGQLAVSTSTGILIVSPAGSYQNLVLPSADCSGTSNALGGPAPPSTCSVSPTAMTVDAAGNIWLSLTIPQGAIDEIPAGSY